MAKFVVSGIDKVMSNEVRGKLGFPAQAGFGRCGNARCAYPRDYGGIYQRTKTLNGWAIVQKRQYTPTNPRTTLQQAWRSNMAVAWGVYNSLTVEQKKALSTEARRYRLSGPSLFLSRYLSALRS